MSKRKFINKNAKREIDKYPMVEVHWVDITSDPSWQSIGQVIKAKLAPCVTKGHLLATSGKVTKVFGDYALKNEETGEIDEVGNTTIIPNSVITKINKLDNIYRKEENMAKKKKKNKKKDKKKKKNKNKRR